MCGCFTTGCFLHQTWQVLPAASPELEADVDMGYDSRKRTTKSEFCPFAVLRWQDSTWVLPVNPALRSLQLMVSWSARRRDSGGLQESAAAACICSGLEKLA